LREIFDDSQATHSRTFTSGKSGDYFTLPQVIENIADTDELTTDKFDLGAVRDPSTRWVFFGASH
jgi:hypothetical protein